MSLTYVGQQQVGSSEQAIFLITKCTGVSLAALDFMNCGVLENFNIVKGKQLQNLDVELVKIVVQTSYRVVYTDF